ncbi:hypothetical protein CFP56_044069 [Quercus suber]|uniref:Uncharacterized protein n=1 Tax=Quercus suber TaxID=58331 RepID=A0AAW0LI75_QUESU
MEQFYDMQTLAHIRASKGLTIHTLLTVLWFCDWELGKHFPFLCIDGCFEDGDGDSAVDIQFPGAQHLSFDDTQWAILWAPTLE